MIPFPPPLFLEEILTAKQVFQIFEKNGNLPPAPLPKASITKPFLFIFRWIEIILSLVVGLSFLDAVIPFDVFRTSN